MPLFADIAFPTSVRQNFTYRIPDMVPLGTKFMENYGDHSSEKTTSKLNKEQIKPGMRVWVPLKSHMSIGMVVAVHSKTPSFSTFDIVSVLDERPVLSNELLKLLSWVHRFYFSSEGEAIQAALPAGMNFISEPRITIPDQIPPPSLKGLEKEIYLFIKEQDKKDGVPLSDVGKHWKKSGDRAVDRLVKKKLLEVWHIPRLRIRTANVLVFEWKEEVLNEINKNGWAHFLKNQFPKLSPEALDSAFITNTFETEPGGTKLPKWVHGVLRLNQISMPSTRARLMKEANITDYTWKKIIEAGLLSSRYVESEPDSIALPWAPDQISELNDDQKSSIAPVLDALYNKVFKRFLLFGVTGSGKTEIYIHALKKALEQGRGGLVLVPEIALTPQTVRRFYLIFGDQIAVLHSRLTDRERLKAWKALQRGEKKIAIGPRSAVFAPVQDPGIIIIDEEHDPSYKQEDPAPRYHARETAVMRAFINKAVIMTGSATPSLTSLQAVTSNKCTLLRLDHRHALAELPEVHVLDLKEYRYAMRGPVAVPLYLAMEEALQKKEQIIILHNRRGFSSFLQCESCGDIPECPHCSVSLTYHKIRHHLRCHYCGYSTRKPDRCPSCSNHDIKEMGSGTQKVEEELKTLFPQARILRMDQDTTSTKGAHDHILQSFANKEAEILMGTQIVAKGLDFPDVTVVGVINSDTELAFPSYRSSERMYQLLSQVAGRSGRGSKPGSVYLQTRLPEHFTFIYTKKHDFPGFAKHEFKSRKKLFYPPFSRLVKILFRSSNEQIVIPAADLFTNILRHVVSSEHVIGPAPSAIVRLKNSFCWETHLKLPPDKGDTYIDRLFTHAFERFDKQRSKSMHSVRITVNVDTMH